MFDNLRIRFGKFHDGSTISRLSREEYLYAKPDGHCATVYIFLIVAKSREADRVLAMESLKRWSKPDSSEVIAEDDRKDLIDKFHRYFRVRGESMLVE